MFLNYNVLMWLLLSVTTILRLLVIGQIGLGDDEAHYWAYSQNPALSYFDHSPAVGYIIKFSTMLFGANEFGVRVSAVIFFFLTCIIVYKLAKKMFDEKIAFWSIFVLSATPVFSFLGSVLIIPDAPLAFFWILFIYIFWKIIESGQKKHWYLLGVVLGFAMLSKYNGFLLPISAGLFLVFSKEHRYWFKQKEPYIALAIASVMTLPVVIWNAQNGWASFGFQLAHGFGNTAPKFSLALLGKCLGAQAGYISPFLFILNFVVLVSITIKAVVKKDKKLLLISAFSLPVIFLFNAIASYKEILPHWPAMGYLTLSIPLAIFCIGLWRKWTGKIILIFSFGLAIALTVLVPLQSVYKVLPPELFLPKNEALKIEDGVTKAEKVDVTNELYGWNLVGKKVQELADKMGTEPFIVTHRHYIASQLSFYVPKHPKIYCLSERADAYDFWQRDLSALNGKDGIFVFDNRFYTNPQEFMPFESFGKPEVVDVYRNGRKIRVFWLYPAKNFKLDKLEPSRTSKLVGDRTSFMEGVRFIDVMVFKIFNKAGSNILLDYFFGALTWLGSGPPMAVLIGIYLWFYRRKTFLRDFLFMVALLLAGGLVVQIIKKLLMRSRPLGYFGQDVRVLGEALYSYSFPSGHSAAAFGAASFMIFVLPKYWWAFLLIASLIGFSRIYVGAHFPIDVVCGAFVGSAVALLAIKIFYKKSQDINSPKHK